MSKKQKKTYLIYDQTFDVFISDKTNKTIGDFDIDWDEYCLKNHMKRGSEIEVAITGELGDCFFDSIKEAKDFCIEYSKSQDWISSDIQAYDFSIWCFANVGTVQKFKNGQLIQDSKVFESFSLVEEFTVYENQLSLNDLEREVLKICCNPRENAKAKRITAWILENLDMISKYKSKNE